MIKTCEKQIYMGMMFLFLIETWVFDKIYSCGAFFIAKNCQKQVYTGMGGFFFLRLKKLSQSAAKHTTEECLIWRFDLDFQYKL